MSLDRIKAHGAARRLAASARQHPAAARWPAAQYARKSAAQQQTRTLAVRWPAGRLPALGGRRLAAGGSAANGEAVRWPAGNALLQALAAWGGAGTGGAEAGARRPEPADCGGAAAGARRVLGINADSFTSDSGLLQNSWRRGGGRHFQAARWQLLGINANAFTRDVGLLQSAVTQWPLFVQSGAKLTEKVTVAGCCMKSTCTACGVHNAQNECLYEKGPFPGYRYIFDSPYLSQFDLAPSKIAAAALKQQRAACTDNLDAAAAAAVDSRTAISSPESPVKLS